MAAFVVSIDLFMYGLSWPYWLLIQVVQSVLLDLTGASSIRKVYFIIHEAKY